MSTTAVGAMRGHNARESDGNECVRAHTGELEGLQTRRQWWRLVSTEKIPFDTLQPVSVRKGSRGGTSYRDAWQRGYVFKNILPIRLGA